MQNTVEEKVNLMNKMARALAKDEGITEVQALARIKQQFMDRDETAETIKGMTIPRIIDYGNNCLKAAPEDAYAVYSEQTKVELKKLEFQQKQLEVDQKIQQKQHEAEQKKAELDARKLELAEKKIESDEKLARERMEREDRYRQDQLALERDRQREDANFSRQMLLMNMGGKKPDEMMEYLKSQTENTKEFYKAQGESQKGLYETLLQTKSAERDREFEWKKELAKIEADREVELEKLRHTTDPETASSTESILSMLGEKLDRFVDQSQKVNNADDFVAKMNEYNKMQDTVIKSSLGILKARGFSEEQLEVVKSAVTSEEDRQKSTIGKLWDVGKEVWKQIEPRILPPEPTPAQAMEQQRHAAEQQRLAREREEKLRKDVELEADRLTAENTVLEQEKARLKQMEETNRALQQKYFKQRDILAGKAMDIGIHVDDRMTNEQIFVAIEARDAEIEREHQVAAQQARERAKQEQAAQEIEVQQVEPEIAAVHEVHDEIVEQPMPQLEPNIHESSEIKPARGSKRKKKGATVYEVTREDGTLVGEIQATRANYAALKAANTLDGTKDNPIKLKVKDIQGEERIYDTYKEEVDGPHGRKIIQPRAKLVRGE